MTPELRKNSLGGGLYQGTSGEPAQCVGRVP